MLVLSKKWFKETGDIPLQIVDSVVTAGLGQLATQTLVDLGWDTKLVDRVGLKLSPDKHHVSHSEFFLRALPTKDVIEFKANNLWQAADPNVKLSITMLDSCGFKPNSNTLAN